MRRILLVFTLFFALTTISFGQEYKKATSASFKKHVVGKTAKNNQTRMVFKKNGSFEGVWQGTNMTAVVKGNYTFTDGQGYCRVATVTLSNGVIKQRPRECFPVLLKGNKMLKIGDDEYKLQK